MDTSTHITSFQNDLLDAVLPVKSPVGAAAGLDFVAAAARLKKVVTRTPLMYSHNLSRQYHNPKK